MPAAGPPVEGYAVLGGDAGAHRFAELDRMTLGHALADLDDVTADLEPRDEGGRRLDLVLAAAQEGVGEVHARRPNPHAHLVGAGGGALDVTEGEDVGGVAECVDLPGADAHGSGGYRSHTSAPADVHGT